MEMRQLGADGPEISVVGFGSWEAGGDEWGPNATDDAVVAAMRAAFDAGLNWIDTAEVYGRGRSEELVARAIKGRGDELLVFTKVAPAEEGSGLRPVEVRGAIEGSLARLGVEHIDLYQVHWPDEAVPIEDTWGAMAQLVEDGLCRWIGLSNVEAAEIDRCASAYPVTAVQNELSALNRRDLESGLLPGLAHRGIGYLAYGPLAFGLLTGTIDQDSTFTSGDWRGAQRAGAWSEEGPFSPGAFEKNLDTVERLRPLAARLGVPLATLSLRWALEQKGVTGVIVGSRDEGHVRANAAVGAVTLDARTSRELDDAIG